jgi:hypothetical protein
MPKFSKFHKTPIEGELFAALEPSDHDVVRAAGNPFLLRRLMVAIGAEQRRRENAASNWSLSFGVALRAVPALAAVTLLFFCLFWFSNRTPPRDVPLKNKVFRAEDNPIATSELPMISNEDLMSIMLARRTPEPRGGQ